MLKQAVKNALGNPSTPTHGYQVSGTARFMQLDANAIRKELGVDESAVLRGRENLPRTDSDAPDDTERLIIKRIDSFLQGAKIDYDGEMQAYEMRLGGLSVHGRSTEITEAARKAEGDFEALVHHAVLELTQLRDERDSAKQDLQAFREQNRLRREASLPKWHPVLSWAVLFFILAVETVFNGMFFGERVAGGLIQGFGEATLFAFVNVACGYICGRFGATKLIHIQANVRWFGTTILIILFFVLFANNLFAAHYRSVLVTDVDVYQAATLAWQNMTGHPFSVGDGKSVQLMGIGMLAAVFAAMKGWFIDEPYPCYGDKTRIYIAKADEFIAAKKDHLHEVTDAYDRAAGRMKTSLNLMEGSLAEYQTVLNARRLFHDAFLAHLNHLETVTNDLLTAYRQKNTEARHDPAPIYFKNPFSLLTPNIEAPLSQQEEVVMRAANIREVTEQLNAKLDTLHGVRKRTMSDLAAIE
jgi:hypothetical protein